jgi:hypothetical protein
VRAASVIRIPFEEVTLQEIEPILALRSFPAYFFHLRQELIDGIRFVLKIGTDLHLAESPRQMPYPLPTGLSPEHRGRDRGLYGSEYRSGERFTGRRSIWRSAANDLSAYSLP